MITMKFLVLTTVLPSTKTLRVKYFSMLRNALEKKHHTEIIWIVYQPDEVKSYQDKNQSIHDIHEFSNALVLLKKLNPDLVLVNFASELVQYSVSLASNFLKIPLVSFSGSKFNVHQIDSLTSIQPVRRFFSSSVSTDSEHQKQFMRRGRFFFYKYLFLLKTKLAIKENYLNILRSLFEDLLIHGFQRRLPPNELADLHLLHHESYQKSALMLGIPKEKLLVIGNPLLDKIHEKFLQRKEKTDSVDQIKLLVITDPLYEHGVWSFNQRNKFFDSLLNELKSDKKISFSLKIHPASENKDYYKKLLDNHKINTEVLQSEDLWDIINDFDMVLSFGYSNSHTEVAFSGMKMILVNIGMELPLMELVKDGIASGHIKKCDNITKLSSLIHSFKDEKIQLTQDFIDKRNKLFFKFDGKSAERGANAIINLINQSKVKDSS